MTLSAPSTVGKKPPRPQSSRAEVRGSRLSPQHSRALSWTLTRACFPHSAAPVTAQHTSSVHQLSVAGTDSAKHEYDDLKKHYGLNRYRITLQKP